MDEERCILHKRFSFTRDGTKGRSLGLEHFTIIYAIERRDIESADRLAHEHTALFHDRFFEFLRTKYQDDYELEL